MLADISRQLAWLLMLRLACCACLAVCSVQPSPSSMVAIVAPPSTNREQRFLLLGQSVSTADLKGGCRPCSSMPPRGREGGQTMWGL